MTDLLHQKWFRPAFLALLICLQLGWLLTAALLRPDFSATENAYLLLATEPAAETEANSLEETPDKPASVTDRCAAWGVPPLYPLLLHAAYTCLQNTGIHPAAVPGLLNLLFFLLAWPLLYFAARRLIRNPWEAALVPFLYGFSAGAALTVRTAGPCMLAALLCMAAVLLLSALQKKPHGKLLHLGFFGTLLAAFLTQYEFLIPALALAAAYAGYCVLRRRYSGMATTLVTAAAALLTGIVVYPACIEHFAVNHAPFTQRYGARLSTLFSSISEDLFGGLFVLVFILTALLILAVCFFQAAAPKASSLAAPSGEVPVAAGLSPADAVHADAEDPAKAAYRRHAARQSGRQRKRPSVTLSEETYFILILTVAALLCVFLLPLFHAAPLAGPALTATPSQAVVTQTSFRFLYPLFMLLFPCLLYRCIPLIGGNQKAALLITAGFFVALAILSFARSGFFAQPLAFHLLAG